MAIETVREFLLWCMVINVGLLLFSFLFMALAHGFVYRIHGRLFHLSEEAFSTTIYRAMAIYKILIICFNVVPWLALVIMA
jgi:hypothetical protein